MESAGLQQQIESLSGMSNDQLMGELVDAHFASLQLLGSGPRPSKTKAFNEFVVPKLVKALCPARKVLMFHVTDLTVAIAIHLASTNPPHVAAAAAIFVARVGLDKFCPGAAGSDRTHAANTSPETPAEVT